MYQRAAEVWHREKGLFDMAGQGSTGNVIAAVCSFFIPGLGQLVQGRPIMALVMFVLAGLLWIILLGWIIHLWSILDAALWKPEP
jgi:TM2 domain-containing membrane protein YozV